ncbi:acireductone synthase [Nocardia iowensis]|uniref:Acireductone synthase n=1 Tax=Nocardia iowensis TaxID=204891 RepID=A0ABX8RYH5_NOCIO|nr:acireductone synthase [Nocardia iowensis]QXN93420.1 acireductone synthase [Nocardia iowensis]
MRDAVLLDIEGTVSPVAAIRDSLVPYARPRIAEWVRKSEPEIALIIDAVRLAMGDVAADLDVVTERLHQWSDLGIRAEPLGALQGLIWLDGFASGALSARFYADVPPVLEAWHRSGVPVYVFCAESELVQQLWFAHSEFGDLAHSIGGYFDSASEGADDDPVSYRLIAKVIGVPPERITFASAAIEKLDAAAAAGLRTAGVSRPDDGSPDVGEHPRITRFSEITTTG